MTDIPAAGYFNGVITNQNAKDAQDQVLAVLREMLGGQAASTLTISGGNATPTRALHAIDTEAAASTDDLDHLVVTNMPDGRVIAIRPADNSRSVVVRHAQGGSGQILLASGSSLTLNDTTMWLLLERRGTDWREISRFYGANLSAFRTFYGVLPSAGGSLAGALNEAKAADVASAASPDIWAGAGNLVHITGTTTITGFAAAPQAGAARVLIFDAALTLTAGANLKLNGGGSNVATAAGDIALVVANTTTSFYAYVIKASGAALVAPPTSWAYSSSSSTGSGSSVNFTGIPAAVDLIVLTFDGVQQSAANTIGMVQIGDSGGIENAGYSGRGWALAGSTAGYSSSVNSDGFRLTDANNWDASNGLSGVVTLRRLTGNVWSVEANLTSPSNLAVFGAVGLKTLSAELDRVTVTFSAAGPAFNGGTVYIDAR
jgi:hypothetical protein